MKFYDFRDPPRINIAVSCLVLSNIVYRNGNTTPADTKAIVTGECILYLRRVDRRYALVSHRVDPILARQFVEVKNKKKKIEGGKLARMLAFRRKELYIRIQTPLPLFLPFSPSLTIAGTFSRSFCRSVPLFALAARFYLHTAESPNGELQL